jgi:prepilin-type N-terminal cleavage/methylation domain-containing protein
MSSRQKGMTLVEVLVGMGILAVLIFASLSLTTSALQQTRSNIDRQFATEKAISILEELKALAQNTAAGNSVVVLDNYDDGVDTKDPLTVQGCPLTCVAPDDPVSGNVMGPHGWLYQRRVSVIRIGSQGNAGVRLVRVAVFRDDVSGMRLLAEVSSVIRTLATNMPQTQVYDVYAIAIENVPGWWVYTATLAQFVQNAVNELMARNPGLEFRVHWVTKLSYGRDQEYRPFINQTNDSTVDINSVYFYPGAMPVNAALNPPALSNYYPTAVFGAHMLVDNNDTNNYDATATPPYTQPYALADQYNHATRYYDEKALFNARAAAGLEDPTAPTYRLLLDDMVMNPTAYTNAILINLHGELFPFPPIRNYSDAAKAPDTVATAPNNLQNYRVVTHPEFQAYGSTGASATNTPCTAGLGVSAGNCLKLRVYSYEAPSGAGVQEFLPVPITVVFPGIDLTSVANTIGVQRIEGGTAQTPATPYAKSNAVGAIAGPTFRMTASVSVVTVGTTPNTLVKLFNSPVRSPQCTVALCGVTAGPPTNTATNMGLPAANLLYNMQYIPAPMENFAQAATQTAFNLDLAQNTAGGKNTARWVININLTNLASILNTSGMPAVGGIPACIAPCSNTALAVATRIGDTAAGVLPATGVEWPPAQRNQPPNLSLTYVWRGTDLWLYGDGTDANPPNLPMTERVQFQGDPRHCPYADLKMPHNNNGGAWNNLNVNTNLGMGYNRYFDDFESNVNGSTTWAAGGVAGQNGWYYTIGGTQYGVKNNPAAFAPHSDNRWDDGWTTNTGGQPTPPPFGQFEIDMPRAFQILRSSLTSSRAIYTTMTGFSYYYVGLGGEIGYDAANQFPNSIPVSAKPFTGATNTTITEQSITNDINWGDPSCAGLPQGCGVKYIRSNGAVGPFTSYWWGMSWLGENYPDAAYMGATGWANTGNLPTGTLNANYKRVLRGTIAPGGTSFNLPTGTQFNGGLPACAGGDTTQRCYSGYNAVRRTFSQGSTTLFWSGAANSTFHHNPNNGNGSLVNEGLDMASAVSGYNYPLLNPIPNNRPFDINLNMTADNPESFLSSVYGSTFVTTQQAKFYQQTNANLPGSALESLRDPNSNKTSFIVVNGLSPTGDAGSSFIARWSFLSLIHSFFHAGLYPVAGTESGCAGCTFRVRQLPRVSITYPDVTIDLNNPATINIQWAIAWKRWDNAKYTPAYAAAFAETEPVQYQVMYSDDGGLTFKWCDTSIPGTPSQGVRSATGLIAANNYNWSVPAGTFPAGNYLIRVEAYRQNYNLHYSYHQFRAYIRRP